jgi:hypothetical protein
MTAFEPDVFCSPPWRESTGVSWKPVFYVLEEAFTCLLVDAALFAYGTVEQGERGLTTPLSVSALGHILIDGATRAPAVPPTPVNCQYLRPLTSV